MSSVIRQFTVATRGAPPLLPITCTLYTSTVASAVKLPAGFFIKHLYIPASSTLVERIVSTPVLVSTDLLWEGSDSSVSPPGNCHVILGAGSPRAVHFMDIVAISLMLSSRVMWTREGGEHTYSVSCSDNT